MREEDDVEEDPESRHWQDGLHHRSPEQECPTSHCSPGCKRPLPQKVEAVMLEELEEEELLLEKAALNPQSCNFRAPKPRSAV